MNIFVCGAETLIPPIINPDGSLGTDADSIRFVSLRTFLDWEFAALQVTQGILTLAYDPTQNISLLFTEGDPFGESQVEQVSLANVFVTFTPDLIYFISGGVAPNAIQQAAVTTLMATAKAQGILIRDASNIPSISPPQAVTSGATPTL